jgi:hypothetical protein
VTLEVKDGVVAEAWAGSPLYRGFEQILRGKHPMDALMFAPRICGICSVSQSMAAASALADAMGLKAAPNGRITKNLAQAVENVADHFTHFYLFFMPDFARAEYAGRAWHARAVERFRAVRGSAAPEIDAGAHGLPRRHGHAGRQVAAQPGDPARRRGARAGSLGEDPPLRPAARLPPPCRDGAVRRRTRSRRRARLGRGAGALGRREAARRLRRLPRDRRRSGWNGSAAASTAS